MSNLERAYNTNPAGLSPTRRAQYLRAKQVLDLQLGAVYRICDPLSSSYGHRFRVYELCAVDLDKGGYVDLTASSRVQKLSE